MDTGLKVVPLLATFSTWTDGIKLYAKTVQGSDSLIHLTQVFSSDIGMTLCLAKCSPLIDNRDNMKSTSDLT